MSENFYEKDNMLTFLDALTLAEQGENPSKAIENQEKRGQQFVVKRQMLPKQSNRVALPGEIGLKGVSSDMKWEEREKIVTRNNIEYTKKQYEKMGITLDERDDLFWSVTLPEGWEVKATEHSMWNALLDDKGRTRAEFFYKAAFYDRDAFINFRTRYSVSVSHVADPSSEYDIWSKSDYQGTVKDGDTVIFSTKCVAPTGSYDGDDKIKDELMKELKSFMSENYPDYKDINAYWD